MDVRNLFSIIFNLEKERSPVQVEIVKTKYIRNAIPTFGKVLIVHLFSFY